jgi:hypothetical protein
MTTNAQRATTLRTKIANIDAELNVIRRSNGGSQMSLGRGATWSYGGQLDAETQARYTELNARRNRLVDEHNAIVDAQRAKAAAVANERRVARESKALRSATCGECFTVHAGECA